VKDNKVGFIGRHVASRSDKNWKRLADAEPYWSVCTTDEYLSSNFNDEAKKDFFNSGEAHVNRLKERIEYCFGKNFSPKNSLDFGCGVGRVLVHLARISENSTGIDVSPQMIAESEKNCNEMGITNTSFFLVEKNLHDIQGTYDFIHSFLVLQHISVSRGYRIISQLLDRLEDGGIISIHFPVVSGRGWNGVRNFFKNWVPLSHNFYNLIKGNGFFSPFMEEHLYDPRKVLEIAREKNISDFFLQGIFERSGTWGVILYAKKQPLSNE